MLQWAWSYFNYERGARLITGTEEFPRPDRPVAKCADDASRRRPSPSTSSRPYALSLGFIACGIADLSPTPHGDVLDRWLAAGYGGVMRYLNRQAKKRKDPRRHRSERQVCRCCYR